MTAIADFRPVAEVTTDRSGHVTFPSDQIDAQTEYLVSKSPSGVIMMIPAADVPEQERIIWEDDEVRKALWRGFDDYVCGRVTSQDDFLDIDFDAED